VFFALRGLTFLSVPNLNNVLVDTSQLLLLTIGVTFVIITAGIDLSISSILILSAVVSAKAMIHFSGTLAETQAYQFPTQHVGIRSAWCSASSPVLPAAQSTACS
jgi:ribose transport system permease protein